MIKILVTNDDGIKSPGLKALVRALSLQGEVYIVAPAAEQSGMSQGVSLKTPMVATKVRYENAKEAYKLTGKPADCVKFGLQEFGRKDIEFDFVFSGINLGGNLGSDVHYSGTVAGAMEGALHGVRSLALSIHQPDDHRFGYLARMVPELIRVSRRFGPETVLNVNAPDIPISKIKGVKFVGSNEPCFNDEVLENEDGSYSYSVEMNNSADTESDIYNVYDGYTTITPLRTSWVDKVALAKLNGMSGVKPICLLIDYQEKLVPAMKKSGELMTNVTKLARCLDRLDLPVLVSQQYTAGLGNTVPELKKALGKHEKVEKIDFSCFGAPGFEERVHAASSKKVILAGIESHICVLQTVLDFIDRGYEVTVLKDCCASRRKQDHEAAMNLLEKKGCTITTWEVFVYMQMGSASHGAFRAISNIVKE